MSESELLALLRRCHAGEDPELLLMEELANSDISSHQEGCSGLNCDGCLEEDGE